MSVGRNLLFFVLSDGVSVGGHYFWDEGQVWGFLSAYHFNGKAKYLQGLKAFIFIIYNLCAYFILQ